MTCKRNAFCFGSDCLEFASCQEAKPIANEEIDALMRENRALKEELHEKTERLVNVERWLNSLLKRWEGESECLQSCENTELSTH